MINLQKMCLSWATANGCVNDWLWLLEQAKGSTSAKTTDALFLGKVKKQLPAHYRPSLRGIKTNALAERMQWMEPSQLELVQQATNNVVLQNLGNLAQEEAEAFQKQESFEDWALICRCCVKWIPQSAEFNEQEPWVKMGWRALMTYQVEPVSVIKTATRRQMPLLYRLVPNKGGSDRSSWLPNGYVAVADERTMHGWNAPTLVLSALALIKYPDSPFYEGPVDDGFWLLKEAQETEVVCTDPLSLVARIEQHKYCVPMHLVRGPDIKIVEESQNETKQSRKKESKAVTDKRALIETADDRYGAAIEFARNAMALAPSKHDIDARFVNSRVNGISRYSALGAPSASVAWREQQQVRGFVPWLGEYREAESWEFTMGRFSPIAFDNAFIGFLTNASPDNIWPEKWEAAIIAGFLMGKSDAFHSHFAGLHEFGNHTTAEGEMTLWEWYYRMHARLSFYKKSNALRMKHLYALTQADKLRGSMRLDIAQMLPLAFHKECPILLWKELGV